MQNLLVDNPNKTGYNLYANNVTVYENMTVTEDLVVAGDMSAERFLPTVNANQDFLTSQFPYSAPSDSKAIMGGTKNKNRLLNQT